MLVYPQLGTGALSQYPTLKQLRTRTVANRMLDGRSTKAPDPGAARTEWTLTYTGLTDAELRSLEDVFAEAEGTLNGFTFLDPVANLLAYSGDLGNAVWQRDPQLSMAQGIGDPFGGTKASRLMNGGSGTQGIRQSLAAPEQYVYCLSAYVRAVAASIVTMVLGDRRSDRVVQSQWSRIILAGTLDMAGGEASFGLEIPAGASIEAFGMQAEPQAGPSSYRESTRNGVYPNAHFGEPALMVTTTGVNQHSCVVHVIA